MLRRNKNDHDHDHDTHGGAHAAPTRAEHVSDHATHEDPAREKFGGFNWGACFFGWLVAIALTVLLTILLIAGFILLIFGGDIGGWLARQLGLGGAFQVVWNLLRYPLVLVGISLALAILYWQGPNIDQQFAWITPGSVIATLAWFLATVGFGLYVQFFAAESFRNTYGAIAGLILFLFYLYLTSIVIMLGAELNAETTKRYDPEVVREKVTDPGKQLPGKQPIPHPQAAREAGVSQRQVAESNGRAAQKLAAGQGGP